MGLLEEIDKLELSDEQKATLRAEHQSEIGSKDDELGQLRRRNRRVEVEAEIKAFSDLGFNEAPGLLKYVRRIFLSDDERPGAVLLSDADLELSGDEATGARSEEEVSVAGAIREFIKLMPLSADGKLQLSDLVADNDHGGPDSDAETDAKSSDERRERVGAALGRKVERSGKRSQGSVS